MLAQSPFALVRELLHSDVFSVSLPSEDILGVITLVLEC